MQRDALDTLRSIIAGANKLVGVMESGEPLEPDAIAQLREIDLQLWEIVDEIDD